MAEADPARAAILQNYCDLMAELKARHEIVHLVLLSAQKRQFAYSPFIVGELCYLQLRMICELIALGCLLVHGDIPATRSGRMKKAYQADWIINRLQELHPAFYPRAGEQVLDDTGAVVSLRPNPRPHLTKDRLLELYAECGSFLHRGSLKNILAVNERHMDFVKIGKWAAQISQLLNHHQISLIDEQHQVWVVMQAKEDGRVHYALMGRVSPDDADRR